MKLFFSSQADKDNALEVARRAGNDACGQMYLYMLEEGVIDEVIATQKVEEEPKTEENVEVIEQVI